MSQRPVKVLIVDDNPANISLVERILTREGFATLPALSGEEALAQLCQTACDLILLDINMPGLDGFATCQAIKAQPNLAKIPIIFLTATQDATAITQAFQVGGVDFVHKPFNATELTARIHTQAELKLYRDYLEERIAEETRQRLLAVELHQLEMAETQRQVLELMGTIAETRSKETGQHVHRVAEYSHILALLSGMAPEEADVIKLASPLHDLGKVGIPDAILHKPGKLTVEEFEVMKGHAHLGFQMLNGSKQPLLQVAASIAGTHHEKWDGSGYPWGIKGEAIPLEGRITAIADVFDALSAERSYKAAWPLERILALFREGRGKHFDPALTDGFLSHLDQFLAVKEAFKDHLPQSHSVEIPPVARPLEALSAAPG